NDTMRVLTFLTGLMGPLALAAGALGMDFKAPPSATGAVGCWGALVAGGGCAVVALVVAHCKKCMYDRRKPCPPASPASPPVTSPGASFPPSSQFADCSRLHHGATSSPGFSLCAHCGLASTAGLVSRYSTLPHAESSAAEAMATTVRAMRMAVLLAGFRERN